ncbi:phage integrase N-terminal SAM-like domain-containing protein [Propionivibrio sp.]|uniref:phage integrase N-terminal SAM-like domain-containing protein n=1 Tax=Propionivibrio sp. TaxID=2212460 RepID=UPI0025D9B050|nr:phage integrase N-terminal SAM-like domain-containing protein [Propionivibrio sp.]
MRTRETYLACVAALAKHYRRPPDQLDAGQIQTYLLHLITRSGSPTPASIRRRVPAASSSAKSCSSVRSGSTSRWPKCLRGCPWCSRARTSDGCSPPAARCVRAPS